MLIKIIGIVFVLVWIWLLYEAWNTPTMPYDYDENMSWKEDPEVTDFLERMDAPGPMSEEDDKVFTVGGLTNDKDKSFSKFQKKQSHGLLGGNLEDVHMNSKKDQWKDKYKQPWKRH